MLIKHSISSMREVFIKNYEYIHFNPGAFTNSWADTRFCSYGQMCNKDDVSGTQSSACSHRIANKLRHRYFCALRHQSQTREPPHWRCTNGSPHLNLIPMPSLMNEPSIIGITIRIDGMPPTIRWWSIQVNRIIAGGCNAATGIKGLWKCGSTFRWYSLRFVMTLGLLAPATNDYCLHRKL